MARPSGFRIEVGEAVCEAIAGGLFLTDVCKLRGMPDYKTVHRWLAAQPAFKEMYARAREEFFDRMAADTIAIADQFASRKDVTAAEVQAARLQIDTRKWTLGKGCPKKYGDNIQLEHTGSVQINQITRKIVDPHTIENKASETVLMALESKIQKEKEIEDANYTEIEE